MVLNLIDLDWKEFKNPPKSARPLVRWWWTGLDVEKEELTKEVEELDKAGFLGAEIQAFMIGSPFKLEKKDRERAKRSHRFMQPYYYDMVKAVLEEASKRGMIMDLTIGSSWPAGGVHISKKESLKVLLIGEKTINGPKRYKGKIPNFKKPLFYKLQLILKLIIGVKMAEFFKDDMKLVAVIAAHPTGKKGKIKFRKVKTTYLEKNSLINLTNLVDGTGMFEWEVPEGKWQIFAFYKGPSGARPLADCRASVDEKSYVMDHFSSEVIEYHLDRHLGEAKKYFSDFFGNTLRGFFTDSLELSSDWTWTDNFLDEFYKRRGYDLTPFLPICFVPNRDNKYLQIFFGGDTPAFDFEGDIGERIRYDLELTVSDLFSEKFVETMKNWAEKNKLKSRIQAYGIRADTLKTYGKTHIPETEQLYAGGVLDFLKLAGSAGVIYERPIITAESIVWNQRDYMTTPLKWKVAADRLFVSGINQMIYHGFPYQNPLFPYPGYCGFSTPYLPRMMNFSSNFSRNNPFWEFFPKINQYVTRCQLILQRGKTACNIALYFPLFNYCDHVLRNEELVGGCLDEYDAPKAKGQLNAHVARANKLDSDEKWTISLQNLADQLTWNGYYYIHANEESILNSTAENKKLEIGYAEIQALIMSNITKLSLDLATKLSEIAEKGVLIIFIKTFPSMQPGFLNYEENDKKIYTIMNELLKKSNVIMMEDLINIPEFLRNQIKIKPEISYQEPQTSVQFIHKKTQNYNYYILRNSSNQPLNFIATFPLVDIPFILNPWNGDIMEAAQYRLNDSSVDLKLFFEPYELKIIEFRKAKESLHAIQCSSKISRLNDKLTLILEEGDKFDIDLNNGRSETIKINNYSLSSIKLDKWQFSTNIRAHDGTLTPIAMEMTSLVDWRNIQELKYCSAKGTYMTTFNLKEEYFQNDIHLYLIMQRVHDVARIFINGNELDALLTYPYELDITSHLKKGENEVRIQVIPTLRNRLIGYGKRGGKKWKNHKKKKEFMPAGLIGPVMIKPKIHFIITT